MGTTLPVIDREQVADFWRRFRARGGIDPSAPVPPTVEPFGDSVELADELIALVIAGQKRATAGALVEYELEGSPLPRAGTIVIATDGTGKARVVLRITDVRVGSLN